MATASHQQSDLHGNVPGRSPVVLVLLDVLNDLDFPGGSALAKAAPALAKNIARLKRRCANASIPAVYVNDNHGKWRSDAPGVVQHCLRDDSPGRALVEPLVPLPEDYIVLKPKHSAFYATPFDTLLTYLGSKTIILTGLTTDACILTTACEIHIRDLNLYIPSDCVAAIDPRQHNRALQLMRKSLGAHTSPSRALNLKKLLKAGLAT